MSEGDVEVIKELANSGVFGNNIWNLMLKVCSEVLDIPLIAITSVKEMGIVTNFPVKCQLRAENVSLASQWSMLKP